jgi:hypothetical protein
MGKNGEVLFDRPKPTAGCSANERRRRRMINRTKHVTHASQERCNTRHPIMQAEFLKCIYSDVIHVTTSIKITMRRGIQCRNKKYNQSRPDTTTTARPRIKPGSTNMATMMQRQVLIGVTTRLCYQKLISPH